MQNRKTTAYQYQGAVKGLLGHKQMLDSKHFKTDEFESQQLSMQLKQINSEDEESLCDEKDQPLVSLNMNIEQLNVFIQNIIKVINQHAKLLNNLHKEVIIRPTEKHVGDILNLLSLGFEKDKL